MNWTSSAFVAAATAAAAAVVLVAKPRDPDFHLISMELTSFKLNFPVLDAELILTIQITNPNITSITYSSTEMSIFYSGDLLGTAPVEAGSQPPRSSQVLRIPARLNGVQLAHHVKEFVSDLAKREMVLDASVDIEGFAKVMWWDHKFRVHVDSHVTVDPVFLDVIDQENKSALDVFAS
ncbi:hypothetical protein K7X08_028014 [Anisodus acutangulus]|uniref:Water stress and hypersensitive response domain-containing protein n=1 Tax=Anisodus acutangulus TaxID=402998 RepID=A0A9Q1MUP4_9SOLA|nr:hypothetical protein K7X08_028014 [Anisodus acutangulus]